MIEPIPERAYESYTSPRHAGGRGGLWHDLLRGVQGDRRGTSFHADFPSVDVPVELLTWMLGHPGFYAVVAELGGKVVGSNFLDERNRIAGVGPITVDPAPSTRRSGDN